MRGQTTRKQQKTPTPAHPPQEPTELPNPQIVHQSPVVPASLAGSFAGAGQNVKVLAIKPIGSTHSAGSGQAGLTASSQAVPVLPTPANIKSGTYPLSQRLYVYVHLTARATARDFVKFIATSGGSEATPYADTVQAVMKTCNKHNVIPLAPAAIQRIAKEAKAARSASTGQAAAKAKAQSQAKPQGKPQAIDAEALGVSICPAGWYYVRHQREMASGSGMPPPASARQSAFQSQPPRQPVKTKGQQRCAWNTKNLMICPDIGNPRLRYSIV